MNLTTWRAPPGPARVSGRLPQGLAPKQARLLVRGGTVPVRVQGGGAAFEIASISDHEVVVLE